MTKRDHGVSTFVQLLVSRRYPDWLRFGGTLALVAVFVALRVSLPVTGSRFVLLLPAVLGSALAFGPLPGALATVLTTLAAVLLLVAPADHTAALASEIFPVVVYLAVASALVVLCHVLRAAVARAVLAEGARTLLLDEMAHRTKNDLQTIASLLTLQARSLPKAEAREALELAATRVLAVAKLHNQLRSEGRHGVVDIRDYLDDLCQDVARPYGELRPVVVKVAAERALLRSAVAGPIGLIVNELVTNAFKYAFPDNRSGTVEVAFRRADTGRGYELQVQDDGVGGAEARDGLGSRLIRQLVAQLRG